LQPPNCRIISVTGIYFRCLDELLGFATNGHGYLDAEQHLVKRP